MEEVRDPDGCERAKAGTQASKAHSCGLLQKRLLFFERLSGVGIDMNECKRDELLFIGV
jgi:hypothetical protein